MKITITASYRIELDQVHGLPGIRRRRLRDGSVLTVVDCDLQKAGDVHYARPRYPVPEDTPRPGFRARLSIIRAMQATEGVAVVARPADPQLAADLEQRLLAPSYVDAQRIVYEFQRGEVLHLAPNGTVEVRLIVVDGATGRVGTRTLASFHLRYCDALARCRAHLAGTTDLFPVPTPAGQRSVDVPEGQADLMFGDEASPPPLATPTPTTTLLRRRSADGSELHTIRQTPSKGSKASISSAGTIFG